MALQSLASRLAKQLASQRPAFVQLTIEDGLATLELPLDQPILLGRNSQPERGRGFDLTPFGAQEKGVSFNHARLFGLDSLIRVVDLGSLNGTFINNHRIPPQSAYILNDGCHLQLGLMQIRIKFVTSRATYTGDNP